MPPSIRVFSNESTLCMRWPKYWSFSFSIIPSKEIPGLISFRMDWLDLLAIQETLITILSPVCSTVEHMLWKSMLSENTQRILHTSTGSSIQHTQELLKEHEDFQITAKVSLRRPQA